MKADADNPLLDVQHPIPFGRIEAEHVRPAVDALLADAERKLAALEGDTRPRTFENTFTALEQVTDRLERAMTVVGHLESVATTPQLREAYNEVQPKVSAFYSKIPTSTGLWAQLRAYAQTDECARLEPTSARFVEKTVDYFRREGAELDVASKARLSKINVELAERTTRFGQNVLDSTNAFELLIEDADRLDGLPERVKEAAREDAKARDRGGYRFTLQAPSFLPVMTHLKDRAIREQLYRAFYTRASTGQYDNRDLAVRIIELRRQKAALLGFENFVDLVLADRMAESSGRAREFVLDLERRSRGAFEQENAALRDFAAEQDGTAEVAPWDAAFLAERQRLQRFDFDEEQLRPYFPLEGVLQGLFELVHRLYGVSVERDETLAVWHETVRAYRVRDGSEELGFFYADLFPREQKRDGAWMNGLVTGLEHEGVWDPHVGLICANVTPPTGGKPALLAHREVETIFHEFGHLMHHMLTRVSVRSLAGTNVAWDFVELPSQIMENWCWEREALDLFARHHETGEPVPEVLFERMSRARTYRGANAMMRQLGFAALDLSMHMDFDPDRDGDLAGYARDRVAPFSPVPPMEEFAMVLSFGHLFSHPVGYAGGYYSYKWAEVLDADAFSRFKTAGVFSREVGADFRRKILSRGDSRDPMRLFEDFMGRPPELEPLLERCGVTDQAAE